MTTRMTPDSRTAALAAMSDERGLDVLVVGGGITGVGAALDAAARGLRVGIVDASDWSDGTSSRSSKLVHGGLRYLQMLDFSLVHEALTERSLFLNKLAPHLVKPVSFLFPLEHRIWQRLYVGAGILLYDVLASLSLRGRSLPWHQHYTKRGMRKLFPNITREAGIGGIRYWDASVDDSRLVITVLRTAVEHGALAASRARVVELIQDADRVSGAVIEDRETGETVRVKAKQVISATGVWTEETQSLTQAKQGLQVLASKGVHIVVPRSRIQGESGFILETEKSVLFIIPWSRYWIIGTTDTPWTGDYRLPAATATDIDYIIERANRVVSPPLTRADVVGVWAGLRPLLQPTKNAGSSAKVSREHTTMSPKPGLTVIAGGKLTTYRVMAADAVDFALRDTAGVAKSSTDKLPLLGAIGLEHMRREMQHYQQQYGWSDQMVEHLLHRYGSMMTELIDAIEAQPDLAQPLRYAPDYLRAEVHYAATHEGVLHLSDVMQYRTRLQYEMRDGGVTATEEILQVIAPVLGWDDARCRAEAAEYAMLHSAISVAATLRDDRSAEAELRTAVETLA